MHVQNVVRAKTGHLLPHALLYPYLLKHSRKNGRLNLTTSPPLVLIGRGAATPLQHILAGSALATRGQILPPCFVDIAGSVLEF
jgi:hypothetical protein